MRKQFKFAIRLLVAVAIGIGVLSTVTVKTPLVAQIISGAVKVGGSVNMGSAVSLLDGPATLPQACTAGTAPNCVEPTFPSTSGYIIKTVCAVGCDYTSLINGSTGAIDKVHTDTGDVNGEIIELAQGVEFDFSGFQTLPAYTMTAGKWVIITTNTAPANLPAQGVRATASYSGTMAKLAYSSTGVFLLTAASANHYWFWGIEISPTAGNAGEINPFIQIGNGEASIGIMPYDIVIDRCYIHGNTTGNYRRAIIANGNNLSIMNSTLTEFHSTITQSQAILTYQSAGPILIQNNDIEATGENFMAGCCDPTIANNVPQDITFQYNHVIKDPAWQGAGKGEVDNLWECKNCQRVLVQGNVIENIWADGQAGFAFQLTPRNAGQNCTWCTTADVVIRYNIIRHGSSAFNTSGADTEWGGTPTSQPIQRVSIHDNLIYDLGQSTAGGNKQFMTCLNSVGYAVPARTTINHNTVIGANAINFFNAQTPKCDTYIWTNNIVQHGTNGVITNGDGFGTNSLNNSDASYLYTANAMENISVSGLNCTNYPAGNFCPAAWTDLGFTNSTTCTTTTMTTAQIGACSLSAGSTYHNAGTDGGDLGANIGLVTTYTSGVE